MPQALDITNQKFGYLTAIKRAENKGNKTYWLCRCECGNYKEVQTNHLVNGKIRSCGKCNAIFEKNNNDKKAYCLICKKEITGNRNNRVYCEECSPSGQDHNPTSRAHSMKRKLIELKGGKCERCGYDKCIDAFEFHHINPEEKDINISDYGALSFLNMIKEAKKCDMLCANCHREKHWEERRGIFNAILTNNDLIDEHIEFILKEDPRKVSS